MDRTAAIRNRLTVPVLAFGGILMAVMQTVVVPLLPDLPRLTGASAGTVSWMVTATLLSGAVLTPVLGRAGDMYGKRRVLMSALALMTAGSVLCALSSDIGVLIAARTLSGAAAAVVPLSISILRDELPAERRGSAVALMSSTVGIGAALGLPLAAVIVQYADWHTMFWVTSALGATGVTLVWWAVRESPVREPGRFDVPGALGLAAGLVCLLLGVSQGGQWGWGSVRVVVLFAGAAVVLALWWWQQLRAGQPLVDLRLVARPRVGLSHVAALLAGFAFYANTLVTAQLVQTPKATGYGLGLSIVATGLCLLPSGVVMLLLSPVSARISAARGPRVTLALGAAVIAAGYAVRIADSRDLWMIIAGATVVATGTTLAYSALPTLILRAVPAGQTASANGVNVLMRTIGQAGSSAAVAAVLVHHTGLVGGVPVPTLHGYLLAFAMAGAVALVATAVALCIPGDAAQDVPDGPGPAADRTRGARDQAMEGA
ncbi:putative MFS family arabinose efflux permease [Streptomyces africanus]|uniref:MFS family arabinose efflux permease n=1 Tax=Streptomyces africanus TaxID=231024 RepID=A0ABU0R207_9ACTN|nr:MFS transporter [Streptomyces africanus]MDQ0753662.1 putative MFS family arabinose efflux permease [Streptomyces africanus]